MAAWLGLHDKCAAASSSLRNTHHGATYHQPQLFDICFLLNTELIYKNMLGQFNLAGSL